MVFKHLVFWISGIFGTSRPVVYKDELDAIVETVVGGFSKINLRISQSDNELSLLRQSVLQTQQIPISVNLPQLDSLIMGYSTISERVHVVESNKDVISNKLFILESTLSSRIDSIVSQKLESMGSSTISGSLTTPQILESLRALESSVNHIKSELVTRSTVESNNVTTPNNNVTTANNNVTTPNNNVTTPNNNVTTPNNNVTTPNKNVTTANMSFDDDLTAQDDVYGGSVDFGQGVQNVSGPKAFGFKPTRTVVTSRNMNKVLVSSLIPVFNELLNAEKFLSYSELSKRLNKKEATARAYVNALKTYGVSIDEQTVSNGRKLVRLAKDVVRKYLIP
ncbi:MAG: hypothetical protein K0B02_00980 [DPANN group archaeon]|nr:hypothetical protein [DPANN group archaeon]